MIEIGQKLRKARRHQKLSLRDLAAMADVSASLLSQIENNRANPSVNTLYRIAAALSLPMDYFFPSSLADESQLASDGIIEKTPSELRKERKERAPGTADDVFRGDEQVAASPVVHAAGRPTIELLGGVTWSRLTHEAEEGIEFLEINYSVGAKSGTAMSHHSGREFGLVLEGTLLVELGFEEYVLQPGDSIIFDSSFPHRLSNRGGQPVRAIWVVLDQHLGISGPEDRDR